MNYIHRDVAFPSTDGKNTIHAELFIPSDNNIRAVVQISHGMMDYIGRYSLMAEALCSAGIALAGNDHLGHGDSVSTPDDYGFFASKGGYDYVIDDVRRMNELIRSEYYQELNDEQRAKAIKNLYALYYNRAASEVTGAEWTRSQAYSLLTDNYSALFAAQAYRSGLEATKDASGKEVTVKAQFVDYMKKLGLSESDYVVIAYANSVRDKQTRAALLAHINSLALSDEAKAKLAEALGFEVKNGKVVEKEE